MQGSVLCGGHRVESLMQLGKELKFKFAPRSNVRTQRNGIYDEGAYNWGLTYSQILCGSL